MKDKEKLIQYIDNWVNNIPIYYDKYKMISKLSIILYGKPGTGKSTVAKAIAKHLDIRMITSIGPDYFYYDSEGGSEKRYNRRDSNKETVYTIDDIDCICKSREEDNDKENTEVLSSLLSFLDNPPTFFYHAKNGRDYPISIVIATTNYYDKLDDAVKRYGRFDMKIEMHDFNRKQAEEMCNIYDLKLSDLNVNYKDEDFTISPSYLQALCLENIDKSLKKVD
jgi:proteasome regulatory subunit